eukprot:CAMPEP_0201585474 /NCGR_PEP_ID=MMETSP0190_2-20130828/122415_1 /ASSEMBLY_ACC=CAM_ASM_000263 /TAXON_ID=37353 /ORGANISM="Rosalina sp." /LENGTH=94 /DNA_ID=CAMNT_0048031501 /DNA_START=15 /DNA_END=296 /DNA_ORIENTATION=+
MCALTCNSGQQSGDSDNIDIIETNGLPSSQKATADTILLKKAGRHKDNIDEMEQIDIKVLNSMDTSNDRKKLNLRNNSSEDGPSSDDEDDWKGI